MSQTADGYRGDLKDAGLGSGNCAFEFVLTKELRRRIKEAGGEVSLRALDTSEYLIGTFQIGTSFDGNLDERPEMRSLLLGRLAAELTALSEGLTTRHHTMDKQHIPLGGEVTQTGHDAFFVPLSNPKMRKLEEERPTPAKGALPAYLDYTRFRLKRDQDLDPETHPDDLAHFMEWYIAAYATMREDYRVPMSRDVIVYCNALIPMGGFRFDLSRLMWWRLMTKPHLRADMDLNDPEYFDQVCFWWAQTEARTLRVEDCMVPQHVIRTLRTVSIARRSVSYPLSTYMARLHRTDTTLYRLDMAHESDRMILALVILIKGVLRPDLLRYLPEETLESLLEPVFHPETGTKTDPVFVTFLRQLLPSEVAEKLTVDSYKAILRSKGFDLDSLSFLSIRPDGHRLHAAALPALHTQPPTVDIQMIGPFEKASGLGQASRLSAAIMEQTGLDYACVDFGMDNPAPEGFSTKGTWGGFQSAKVNLIHLNAESIPLVYAYGPDVFTGAYNIGYFYWELDSPALCHSLALDLLDEIWVSSDYGVEIYQPSTEKPVFKAGMCFEDLPEVTRDQGRFLLSKRFRFTEDQFVFLVAFDSYSFVQRKNPIGVLKAFQAAFPDTANVRLVIKTQNRDNISDAVQARIWQICEGLIANDPRIVVLNETLSYSDLIALKKGADCYVSLHKSEGWGFGMIEAMNLGVPVIATAYSGNMEFCTPDTAFLVDYEETLLGPDDYIFVRQGQKWAEPSIDSAAAQMRLVYSDPEARTAKTETAMRYVRENFSDTAIATRYRARLILKARDAQR